MNELPELPNPLIMGKICGENISPEVYHRQSVDRGHPDYMMGRSELDAFNTCPSKWRAGWAPKESQATEWGSAFDCLILTPTEFPARFATCPETYPDSKTKEPKPWTFQANYCKEWRDKQGQKAIIKHDTFDELTAATNALLSDKPAASFVTCSRRQVMVTALYADKETGITVPVKVLIDLVPDKDHPDFGKSLGDLKTCTCASPRVWSREVEKYRLHWQAALYLDAYVSATGEDRLDFRHVIVESDPPYQTARRMMSLEFITLGRMQYIEALKSYCRCLKTGIWPDYEQAPATVIDGWGVIDVEAWMVKI